MDSSKISIKLFVEGPLSRDLKSFVPVFHSWIQTRAVADHLLIDVADYSHVHHGPGIVLVAHEANYSLDERGGRAGLTYQRKQPISGAWADRVKAAYQAALHAASLLQDQVKFRKDEIELRLCDRLHAPANRITFDEIKGDLLAVWPGAQLTLSENGEQPFTVTIRPA